jgi:hypothetical protein
MSAVSRLIRIATETRFNAIPAECLQQKPGRVALTEWQLITDLEIPQIGMTH